MRQSIRSPGVRRAPSSRVRRSLARVLLLLVSTWAVAAAQVGGASAQPKPAPPPAKAAPAPAAGGPGGKPSSGPVPKKPKTTNEILLELVTKIDDLQGQIELVKTAQDTAADAAAAAAPNAQTPAGGKEAAPRTASDERALRVAAAAKQHKARVEALIAAARRLDQSCKREDVQRVEDVDPDKAPKKKHHEEVCVPFCDGGSVSIPFCRLAHDPVAAHAAVMADFGSAKKLAEYTNVRVEMLPPPKVSKGLPPGPPVAELLTVPGASLGAALPAAALGSAVADVSVQALQVSLAALARLIEDRAKREGIAWLLQRIGDEMCGLSGADEAKASSEEAATIKLLDDASTTRDIADAAKKAEAAAGNEVGQKALLRREIRAHWFPALCGLAGESGDLLVQYGGGGKLLEGLRSAVASDMKGWPGAAAGLGLAATFWEALPASVKRPHANLFLCSKGDSEPVCGSVAKLRAAGADFVAQLFAGQSTTSAFFTLGTRVDLANTYVVSAGNAALYSEGLQVAACAASVPHFFETYGEPLQRSFEGTSGELDRIQQSQALIAAALASVPACFTIAGHGVDRADCKAFGGQNDCFQARMKTALQARVDAKISLERVSTALRLVAPLGAGAQAVAAQWGRLQLAVEAYEKASQASLDAIHEPLPPPPDLSKVKDPKDVPALLGAAADFADGRFKLVQQGAFTRQLQAVLAVAQSSVDLGGASIGAVEGVLDKALFPGFSAETSAGIEIIKGKLGQGRDVLAAVSKDLSAVAALTTQDWATLATSSLASVTARVNVACGAAKCLGGLATLSRRVGFLVTLVSEKDPDRLAEALDSLAAPPGGWRSKGKPGSLTVSLAAFAGFGASAELRHGQYGVGREWPGRGFYGNTPALLLPVGVDIAVGTGCPVLAPFGVFVSLIDPAAFLQYDVNEEGRLPGPRLTTALSPGVWFRFGIKDTPLSINPYFVYRPGLRAWDPAVDGPAADALQFGLSATVDVTLWELYARHRDH